MSHSERTHNDADSEGQARVPKPEVAPRQAPAVRADQLPMKLPGQGQELSATVWGMVALAYCADPCSHRRTGKSSTKRVERVNSLLWDPSNTRNGSPLQQGFFAEESNPVK
jgi:hypothetical protein